MALFSKKDRPNGIPVDQVMNLKQQGMDNNQVIETLQRDGFNSSQIFDAMTQAEIKSGAPMGNGAPTQGVQEPAPEGFQQQSPPSEQPANPQPEITSDPLPQASPPAQESPFNSSPVQPQPMMAAQPIQTEAAPPIGSSSTTEELVETIINEKWEQLVKDINKIIEWKKRTEEKFITMEQQFTDLKETFDKLHQAVIGKIADYDKHILDVGAEVKAMEKVFSKVLPVFTENVNELSKVTDTLKKK